MVDHYADSSFLVSCYVLDGNTPLAKAWLSQNRLPLPFTALHALEVRNALKLGVFRGLLTAENAVAAWRNVERDLRHGRLLKTLAKWPVVFRIGARLAENHSPTIGTRSLDILHVAIAKATRAEEFLSFDTRQRTLAATLGLRVSP